MSSLGGTDPGDGLCVLVTGFGPFLDHKSNPSDRLARALHGRRSAGVRLVAHTPLPVRYGRAAQLALDAATRSSAGAIVAIGLASGATQIWLERWAHNRCTSPHPDAHPGVRPVPRQVIPGAPRRLAASLPWRPVQRALASAGHLSGPSEHAGGYVCNDLYYRLLHTGRPSLFIHVPDDVDPRRLAAPLAIGIARAVITCLRDVPR